MLHYMADFETTGYDQYLIDGHVRVFMWVVSNIIEDRIIGRGTDLDSFLEFVTRTRKDKNVTVYFHNLKFDGSFIVNHLLKNGWKHVERFSKQAHKEFRMLVSNIGVWFTVNLKIVKGVDYIVRVKFVDSYKKIAMPVERIARVYGLDISKGDFDYDMYRPLGYEPTDEEWWYAERDVLIVGRALKEKLDKGMDRLTFSSDAYKNLTDRYEKRELNYLFPSLDTEIWEFIRDAYKGGWVLANEKHIDKVLTNVLSYDVNSLYPSVMLNNLLPHSLPRYFYGKYEEDKYYPLYVQKIEVSFDLREGFLPTLQTSSLGRFTKDLFLTTTNEDIIELTLTNIDLEIFLRHHEVHYIKYIEGYKFRASAHVFKSYIEEWGKLKEESIGGERQIAKDMMNSLYGKFGSRIKNRDKHAFLEKGVLKFTTNEEKEMTFKKYIPVAVFTTAHARSITIGASQRLYDNHVYSDTDSLKVVGITEEEVQRILEVDDTKLGAWKFEGRYDTFKALKAKHYAYTQDDKLTVVASGLPEQAKGDLHTIDDFRVGFKAKGKLVQRQVEGGVVLIPIEHEIR